MSKVKRGPTAYWWDLLDKVEAAGKYSEAHNQARGKSSSWVTCACGKQDPRIPRTADHKPKDRMLSELGTAFDFDVFFLFEPITVRCWGRRLLVHNSHSYLYALKIANLAFFERPTAFRDMKCHA